MKRVMAVSIIFLSLMLAAPGFSKAGVVVEVAAIATEIVERAPIGVGENFPYTTEKLYCYSKITGGEAGDYVEHRWYHGDTLMATVPLTLGGPVWRTHSSKRIIRIWEGGWRVDIVHAGEVIKSLSFTITAPEEPYSDDAGDEIKINEAPGSEAPASEE
jgi:hypothetical protein